MSGDPDPELAEKREVFEVMIETVKGTVDNHNTLFLDPHFPGDVDYWQELLPESFRRPDPKIIKARRRKSKISKQSRKTNRR